MLQQCLRAGCLLLCVALLPLSALGAPGKSPDEAPIALEMLDVRGPWQLDGLTIDGLPAFRVWLVESSLQTRPLPFWDFWSKEPEFVPAFLEADAETVRRQLERDGWYDAVVEPRVRVLRTPDRTRQPARPGRVHAELAVRRGERLRVCSLLLDYEDGAPQAVDGRNLRASLPLVVGEPFRQADYEQSVALLEQHFHQAGHPMVTIGKKARVDIRTNCAEVAFSVSMGPKGHFGATRIEMPEGIREPVARRQIGYVEGEPYDSRKVQASVARLRALGIFSLVRLKTGPRERDGSVPMTLELEAGPSREIRLGAGYGTDDGFRGIASWWDYNFFGDARQLGFSAKISQVNSAVDASFVQPHLFFANSRGSVSLTVGRDDESTYLDDYLAVTPRLDWAITDAFTARVYWQSRYDSLSGVSEATIEDLGPQNYVNSGFTNLVGAAVSLSLLDSKANPTRGFSAGLGGEVAGGVLGADFNYYKVTAEAAGWYPLYGKLVGSLRARAATMIPYGSTAQVPLWARLYAGGTIAYPVRGYARRRVGPLSGSDDPLGGQSVVVASAQLQYPVFGPLWVVGFVDAGNVELSSWTMRPRNIQTGVGAGLRAVTPIGPVQLDLGFGLNHRGGDNLVQVNFSIGPDF